MYIYSGPLLAQQYSALTAALPERDWPGMEKFVQIYGKILTNSFSLRSDRSVSCDSSLLLSTLELHFVILHFVMK